MVLSSCGALPVVTFAGEESLADPVDASVVLQCAHHQDRRCAGIEPPGKRSDRAEFRYAHEGLYVVYVHNGVYIEGARDDWVTTLHDVECYFLRRFQRFVFTVAASPSEIFSLGILAF